VPCPSRGKPRAPRSSEAAVTKQSGAANMESERRCLLGANDRNAQMDTGSPVGL